MIIAATLTLALAAQVPQPATATAVAAPAIVKTSGAVQPAPAAVDPPDEKPTCRFQPAVGSMIGGRKVCHTQKVWNRIDRGE